MEDDDGPLFDHRLHGVAPDLDEPPTSARDGGRRLVRRYEAELKYARREAEEERFD